MNAACLGIVAWLGAVASSHAPDLQVEAVNQAGVAMPELADAVARALVAGGARVVLRGPTSGPCVYCAKVLVVETASGSCRIDLGQDQHESSAVLHFPGASTLFDRARAIAIQARLLLTSNTGEETRGKEAPAKPVVRRSERKPSPAPAASASRVAKSEAPRASETSVSLAPGRESATGSSPADLLAVSTGSASAVVPPPNVVASASGSPGSLPATAPPTTAVTTLPVARTLDTSGSTAASPPTAMKVAGATEPDSAPSEPTEPGKSAKPTVATQPTSSLRLSQPGQVKAGERRGGWPWIPIAVGGGAAITAGICALVARDRYNALSDRSQSYASALATKQSGETWQWASYGFAGLATAGLGTGLLGLWSRHTVTAQVSVLPGGGMMALRGDLP